MGPGSRVDERAPSAAERAYAAVAPLVFHALHLGVRLRGAAPDALAQRTGAMPACAAPCLWLHGASAGEMAAAVSLVALLRAKRYRFSAAYTTTNAAGLELIARRLAAGDVSALVPWDVPRWIARALDCWRPLALVLIETELWPGLIRAAAERGVPVLSASARIFPRDRWRYRLCRGLMRPVLRRLTAVLAQSDVERAQFVALGAPTERCAVAGNLKHAGPAAVSPAAVSAFQAALGLAPEERPCVIGSLHADEIAFVAPAVVRAVAAGQRVIVAPRHAAGLRDTAAAAARQGWRVARRTDAQVRADWHVLLLDTMGELHLAYAAARVAVVGGAFARHGGHDIAEPVRAGAPVLFGTHTAHVAGDAAALRAAEPAAEVATPSALAERLAEWTGDAALRQQVWRRQHAALPDAAAVAARYLAALAPWLEGLQAGDAGSHG